MSAKDKLNKFRFRFKIFIWYLLTEPLRQLKDIYVFFIKILKALNKTLTWAYVGTIFMIISLFLGKRFIAGVFLIFLLFTLLMWEWESGKFMYRYRQITKRKIKEEYKKNGNKRNK
jgi:hypothetical protein